MSKHRRKEREGLLGPRVEAEKQDEEWSHSERDDLLNYLFEQDSVHVTVYERYGERSGRKYKAVKRQTEQFCHCDSNNQLKKYLPQNRPWRSKVPIGPVDRYFVHTTWDSFEKHEVPYPLELLAQRVLRRPEDQTLEILYKRRMTNQRAWDKKMKEYRQQLGIE